ncbi:uncharacterized protein LOC100185051 [Ciona intestinalis]
MRLTLSLLQRMYPKSSFRRPMEGRNMRRKKQLYLWPMTFGELDEEIEEDGRRIPVRDRVPEVVVPDLKDFLLKPYVTYRAEEIHQPPTQAKDLFDAFYAPAIEAELQNVPLETVPESVVESDEKQPKENFLTKMFKKDSAKDDSK